MEKKFTVIGMSLNADAAQHMHVFAENTKQAADHFLSSKPQDERWAVAGIFAGHHKSLMKEICEDLGNPYRE